MAGRPRKPSKIKQIQGTERPCRVNPAEPSLTVELPEPPSDLPDRVREKYHDYAERIVNARYMTVLDMNAVLSAAQAYVDWREACEMIEANGGQFIEEPITNSEGDIIDRRIKAHPAVAVRNEADKRHMNWLTRLGLTPADRSRVSTVAQKDAGNKFAGLSLVKSA